MVEDETDSLGDSFNVTLLTGPAPSVMLLRSREGAKPTNGQESEKAKVPISNSQLEGSQARVWWCGG